MIWVGLTGGIASGKSSVSEALRRYNFPVVDADDIAKAVVKSGTPGLSAVVGEFGVEILDESGEIDRRKLGQKVFGRREQLRKLEALVHPLVRTEVERQRTELAKQGFPLAIYDIPLLFEVQAQDQFDYIVVVSCQKEQQFQRMAQRDRHLTSNEIKERLNSQMPIEEKEKRANFVVRNDKDISHLEKEVERLVTWLKKISTDAKN